MNDFSYFRGFIICQFKTRGFSPKKVEGAASLFDSVLLLEEQSSHYFTPEYLVKTFWFLYLGGSLSTKNFIAEFYASDNKNGWLQEICSRFGVFFATAKTFSPVGVQPMLPLLHRIGETSDWRIVLLVVFLQNEQKNPLFEQLHKNLEICALKYSASRCRTDRLPELAFRFFNDSTSYTFAHLCADVERIANSGFSRNCQSYETGLFRFAESHKPYKNVPLTKYLLWHFEAEARKAKGLSELTEERYIRYTLITLDEVFQNPALSPIQTGIAGYALISKALWLEIRDAKPEQKAEVLRKSDLVSTDEIFHDEGDTENIIMERNHRIIEFLNHYVKIQHTT